MKSSLCRILGEFLVGKPHRIDHNLIRPDLRRRFEASGAARGNIVVLVHAVAAYAESTDKGAVPVKAHAAREENNAAFVGVRRPTLKPLRAGIRHILRIQIEKWSGSGAIEPRGKNGCAPYPIVRLVTAVPIGTRFRSAAVRRALLKYTILRALVAATSILNTVESGMRRKPMMVPSRSATAITILARDPIGSRITARV